MRLNSSFERGPDRFAPPTGCGLKNTVPLISVVIPAHNSSATIRDALESVAFQAGEWNYEVILVNDASSDDTQGMAGDCWMSFGLDRSLEIVEMERNGGPAAARNRGIEKAGGEWIAFLDADDAWLPDRLERGAEYLSLHPETMMVCAETLTMLEEQHGRLVREKAPEPGIITLRDFVYSNPVATSTVLVRKRAVEAAGGFDEQFRGPEDYDLWMRIAKNDTIVKFHEPWSRYRHEVGSLSMDDRKFLPEVLRVFDKAYGTDGVLRDFAPLRNTTISAQYWNAAWMAFHRGSRIDALKLLGSAWSMNLRASEKVDRKWFRMFLRYLLGGREE